jgi:O-antigen/teichoic acid export membrane protein
VIALRWLCLIPFFRAFQLSAADALAGAGKQSWRLAAQMIAAGANVAMNIYLIPRYSWHGAAWSSLATDAMLGVSLWSIVTWIKNSRPTTDMDVPGISLQIAEAEF